MLSAMFYKVRLIFHNQAQFGKIVPGPAQITVPTSLMEMYTLSCTHVKRFGYLAWGEGKAHQIPSRKT